MCGNIDMPKLTVVVYYHPSGTHINHVASREWARLHCMTINIGCPTRDLRLLPYKNQPHLGWIWVCSTIAMAEAYYDGLLSPIYDPHRA